jgi:hypothetical protein
LTIVPGGGFGLFAKLSVRWFLAEELSLLFGGGRRLFGIMRVLLAGLTAASALATRDDFLEVFMKSE